MFFGSWIFTACHRRKRQLGWRRSGKILVAFLPRLVTPSKIMFVILFAPLWYHICSRLPFSDVRLEIQWKILTREKITLLTLQPLWLAEPASNQRFNSTSDLLFWWAEHHFWLAVISHHLVSAALDVRRQSRGEGWRLVGAGGPATWWVADYRSQRTRSFGVCNFVSANEILLMLHFRSQALPSNLQGQYFLFRRSYRIFRVSRWSIRTS